MTHKFKTVSKEFAFRGLNQRVFKRSRKRTETGTGNIDAEKTFQTEETVIFLSTSFPQL